MRFKAVVFCGLSAGLIVASSAAAQTNDAQVRCPSADAVLSRYIAAMGGAEALERLETRVADARQTLPASFKPEQTQTYSYHFEWKAPNKAVAEYTHVEPIFGVPVPFARARFVFDGERWSDFRGRATGERRVASRDPLISDGPYRTMLQIAADPLMVARGRRLYSGFSLANDFSEYPDRCILRAARISGRVDLLYFDAATGFLRTWRIQGPTQAYVSFEFDDYRPAGPAQFPFYLYCSAYKAIFRFTTVVHNRPLPDRHFLLKH